MKSIPPLCDGFENHLVTSKTLDLHLAQADNNILNQETSWSLKAVLLDYLNSQRNYCSISKVAAGGMLSVIRQ
jgi:hypothetical protein